jgi:glutamyl-tRNA reductase
MHTKLGTLSEEQIAAVEALTRGLVNKFLHVPMQALKQAARENDATRVEALCDAWSLPTVADHPSNLTEIPSATAAPTTASEESERAERRENQASAVGGK